MAEFASAIVGLIQVTEHVALRIYRYVKHVKKAEQEILQLSATMTSLLGIIHGIELAVRELDSHSRDHVLQSKDLVACKSIISQMNSKLSVFSDASQINQSGSKIQKRWKWPFSIPETIELSQKLEAHKTALNLSLATDSLCAILRLSEVQGAAHSDMKAMKRMLEAQTRIAITKKKESVLRRLTDFTPLHHQKTNSKLRQPGTGDWFVDSPEFQAWLATSNTRLWVYGIPGAGKSILMAHAVETILSLEDPQTTDNAVAYFYCDYKDNRTQAPQTVLGSIAQQMARQDERSFSKLEAFIKTHSADKQSATLSYENEELCDLICDMAANFANVMLVVDGLDECEEHVGTVTHHLADLARRATQIKTLLSSRDVFDIRRQVSDYTQISVAARNSDLLLYVGEQVGERMIPRHLNPLRIKDPALKSEIIDTLVNRADGMFRWVAVQLDYICGLPTDKAIREALNSLPPDLFSSYQRLLLQLNKKPQAIRDLVRKAISWILYEDGDMDADSACLAVSINPGMHRFDLSAVPDRTEILRHCGSFIRENFNGSCFESAHFTVAEFFRSIDTARTPELMPYRQSEIDAHRYFAETALTCLCFDEPYQGEIDQRFWFYLVRNWFEWSQEFLDDTVIIGLIQKFFSRNGGKNLRAWAKGLFDFLGSFDPYPFHPADVIVKVVNSLSPLHYAAMLHMPELCRQLIDQGCSATSINPLGSPLHCALMGLNSIKMWRLTAGNGSLTLIYPEDFSGFLNHAVLHNWQNRHPRDTLQILQLLVSAGAEVNDDRVSAGQLAMPPSLLDLAAYLVVGQKRPSVDLLEGLYEILIYLIDKGVEFRRSESLQKLLELVDVHLSDEVLKPLIGRLLQGPVQCVADSPGREKLELIRSHWRRHNNGTYTLDSENMQLDASISKTADGLMFSWFEAAKYNYTDVIAYYLSTGLQDIDVLDEDGFSALHLAIDGSSLQAMELLVERGANINRRSEYGTTPLLLALERSPKHVIKYLLSNGADYICKDCDDENVWHFASENTSLDALFELSLLPQPVQALVNAGNFLGQTALLIPTMNGAMKVFLFLVDEVGADEWTVDNAGRGLLHHAAAAGMTGMVEQLISRGHNPLDTDVDGYNALLHAAKIADQGPQLMECMRMIYEADPNCSLAQTNDGKCVEDFIIANVVFGLEEELIIHWNEVQAILMRDPELSIRKWISEVRVAKTLGTCESVGEILPKLVDLFQRLLQDCSRDFVAILEDAMTTMLPIYFDVREGGASKLDPSLFCLVIDALTPRQLQDLRIGEQSLFHRIVSCGVSELLSCLTNKTLDVDAMDEKVQSRNAVQIACQYECHSEFFDWILRSTNNLGVITDDGRGLLHLAAEVGAPDKVAKLVTAGLEVNMTDTLGRTPLHLAARNRKPSTVGLLLSHGADPMRRDRSGWTPPHLAAHNGDADTLREFSAYKESLQMTCVVTYPSLIPGQSNFRARGISVVHLAASSDLKCLECLLEMSADLRIDGAADQDLSPVFCAVWARRRETVQYLLAAGANTGRFNAGLSPLHIAASRGDVSMVKLLLDYDCDIEIKNKQGLTPLTFAERNGHVHVISVIRTHAGKRELAKTDFLSDALGFAIDREDLAECKRLLADGASLHGQCSRETRLTPFLHSLYRGYVSIASYFLTEGANCNVITPEHLPKQGFTALHYCVYLGDKSLLEAVLKACPGLLFVATDIHPVHLAIVLHRTEILQVLLEESSHCWQTASSSGFLSLRTHTDVNMVSRSAFESHKFTNPAKLGIVLGPSLTEVQVRSRSGPGLTSRPYGYYQQQYEGLLPLHCAARASNIQALRLLISCGAIVESLSGSKTTPLQEAVCTGSDEIVSLLLDAGSSVHGFYGNCISIIPPVAARAGDGLYERISSSVSHTQPCDITSRGIVQQVAGSNAPGALIRLGISADSLTIHDAYGQSALTYCQENKFSSLHSYILNSQIDLSVSTSDFGSAVNERWHDGYCSLLRRLLRRIGRIVSTSLMNTKPRYRNTPLYNAAATEECRILKLLLTYEVDLDMVGGPLGSALVAAATYGRLEAVKILVDAGAAISYFSVEDDEIKSAFVQAEYFPKIQRWLLVERFTEKKRLTWK